MSQELKPEEILKAAREAKGYTQTQLGELVGLKLRTYQTLESGVFPTFKTDSIQKLDTILGTNLYALIYAKKRAITPLSITVVNGDGQTQTIKNRYLTNRRHKKNEVISFDGVPVYDIDFAAGFVELVQEQNQQPIATLSIPEVQGCDYVIRAKGDSMADLINDKDWIGIKRVEDKFDLAFSNVYAIVTKEFYILKFVQFCEKEGYVTLASYNNSIYPPYPYELNKIIDIFVVKTILPFSKIKTLI